MKDASRGRASSRQCLVVHIIIYISAMRHQHHPTKSATSTFYKGINNTLFMYPVHGQKPRTLAFVRPRSRRAEPKSWPAPAPGPSVSDSADVYTRTRDMASVGLRPSQSSSQLLWTLDVSVLDLVMDWLCFAWLECHPHKPTDVALMKRRQTVV
jgi:hypothetical protein